MVESQSPADVAPAATHALGLTEQLADEWGVDLPETPAATFAASPTQAPTPATTPSPGEIASPLPTPQAATPTPPPPSAAPQVP